MNEQDYIRKAVELADEWEVHTSSGDDRIEHEVLSQHHCYPLIDNNCDQFVLDMLAAQLVRQVEATGKYYVAQYGDGRTAVLQYSGGQMLSVSIRSKGQYAKDVDRTMNTIRAIVDSEVLE